MSQSSLLAWLTGFEDQGESFSRPKLGKQTGTCRCPVFARNTCKRKSRTNELLPSHWSGRGSAWQEGRNLQSPVRFQADHNVRKSCAFVLPGPSASAASFGLSAAKRCGRTRLTTSALGVPSRDLVAGSGSVHKCNHVQSCARCTPF